jgi:hypothetical protein
VSCRSFASKHQAVGTTTGLRITSSKGLFVKISLRGVDALPSGTREQIPLAGYSPERTPTDDSFLTETLLMSSDPSGTRGRSPSVTKGPFLRRWTASAYQ